MKNNARALWNIHGDHGLVGSSNCRKAPVKVKGHSSGRSWSCILSLALAAVTFASMPLSANAQLSGRISSASEPVATGQTQPGQNPIPGLAPAPRPPSPNRKPDTGISPYYPPYPPPAPRKYEAPYPFTAEELWEKLLKVIAMPEGYVTREQVVVIFGVRLKLNERAANDGLNAYGVDRGINWYFDMSVMEIDARSSRFYFGWGRPPGQPDLGGFWPPPPGMCLSSSKIDTGVRARGWEPAGQLTGYDIQNERKYRKGKRGLLIAETDKRNGCLLMLTLTATDNADFMVR